MAEFGEMAQGHSSTCRPMETIVESESWASFDQMCSTGNLGQFNWLGDLETVVLVMIVLTYVCV